MLTYKQCRDEMRSKLVRLDVLEKEKALGILSQSNIEDGGGTAGGEMNATHRGRKKRGKKASEDDEDDDGWGTRSSNKRARRTAAEKTNYSPASEVEDSDDMDEDYDDRQVAAKPQPQQLKRKPTVTYHSMNRKKLVELCKKEGLETQGNEKELKQRHSDFITMNNSECDSEHPRSVKELLKEIKNRERSIKVCIVWQFCYS